MHNTSGNKFLSPDGGTCFVSEYLDVTILRVRLLKIADNVDAMSKRIAALDTDVQLEATLQKRIRHGVFEI